jgi:hypothetical protein
LESLEGRMLLSAYVVTTTADSGPGSLRDALNQTNADVSHTLYPSPGNPNADEIDFAITSASDTGGGLNATTGVATIKPQSGLPGITSAVMIDGWSQPGFAGTPLIELNGAGAGDANGLDISAATTVRGLVINRFSEGGISVHGTSSANTWIYGNYIGVDPTGTMGEGNLHGVFIQDANLVTIGSNGDGVNDVLERNVISGQNGSGFGGEGVRIERSTAVTIQGNYLGTNATGDAAIANQDDGVRAGNSSNLRIVGNLMSGGSGYGVILPGPVDHVVIQGNRIGTNAAGTAALGDSYGVYMIGVHDVTIGGTTAGARNVISGNFLGGISSFDSDSVTIQGNFVGTDLMGSYAIPNQNTAVKVSHAGSTNVLIGGTVPGAGNLISGNAQQGVSIEETNGPVWVEGNTIGTDRTGAYAIGNGQGVGLRAANGITIGGTDPAARNLISGNGGGVDFGGGTGNLMEGNFIGTNSSGTAAVPNAAGVAVGGTNNMVVNNLISGNTGDGIDISGTSATGNLLQNNYVGLDATGQQALGNGGYGVSVTNASANQIASNVISANGKGGVYIGGNTGPVGNQVFGNIIGSDKTGSRSVDVHGVSLGNNALASVGVDTHQYGDGIDIVDSWNNLIGGTGGAATRNVIANNANNGIELAGNITGNIIEGNYVGTNAGGSAALPNNVGVYQRASSADSHTVIGGNTATARNVISGNSSVGVDMLFGSNDTLVGNYIGTDSSGTSSLGDYVSMYGESAFTLGGTASGAGNVIDGVSIQQSSNVVVQGNFFGTTASGNAALHHGRGTGVEVNGPNSTGVLIGGSAPGAGNVIAGFNIGVGMNVHTHNNIVQGNWIGTDPAGDNLGNTYGMAVYIGAVNNTIGGTTAGARNFIDANVIGVLIGTDLPDPTVSGNVLQGNFIGLAPDGHTALGNTSDGVLVQNAASGNTIGGVGAGQGNTVAYNGHAGVRIQTGSSNTISTNSIHDNTGLGIELDNGSNDGQTAPVLTAAISSTTRAGISGSLTGVINAAYRIEFFANAAPDPSGAGQGQTYLGFATVTTDGSGHAGFTLSLVNPVPAGQRYVSATATAPDGSTSAFAQDVQATLVPSTTSVSPSLATPLFGVDSVTFTATVGAAVAGFDSPGGSVQFAVDSTPVGAAVPLIGGSASFSTSTLAVGAHTISATYSGDSSFQTSLGTTTVTVIPPASLSGVVFSDFNHDGQVDFGEQGIAGVPVTLTGTDDLGHAVSLSQATDGAGTYVFLNLRPGTYTITQTQQPAGYTPGINSVGTGGGSVSGAQFTGIVLAAGENALNYNYGEQPAGTGPIQKGQTAEIGFWNNTKGQALIKALNGGAGTQLGDWLAVTFSHMFGAWSGGNSLAGKSNADVAAFFQSRFVVHGQRLDAQVLATALAVYVTDGTLDNTGVGTQYGFTVGGNGVATATYNVGTNGAAFGVTDNTVMTVLDLLLAADAQAVNGVLYNGNTAKRNMANNVFSAINQAGSI